MSWYTTGTIAVTNGNATITGTGTAFVANVQPGFAFLGPDYSVYEVLSVNSDTGITLTLPYRGATQSAQAYGIFQTQGIISNLSTQVATLLATFGPLRTAFPAILAGTQGTSKTFVSGTDFTPGTTTTLTLSQTYTNTNQFNLFFDASFQGPDQFTIAGSPSVATFSSAIPVGVARVYERGATPLGIGTPADGSVTVPKLASDTLAYFTKVVDLISSAGASFIGWIQLGTGAVKRLLQDKLRESVSLKDFGALGGATDDTAAWTAAVAHLSCIGGGDLKIPNGMFSKNSSTLLVPDFVNIKGAGKRSCGMVVSSDVVGIRTIGSNSTLKDFSVTKTGTHTHNGIEVGDLTYNARETVIDNVYISGVGGDGIQVRQGNLGTLRDISSVGNGGDGVAFTAETPDTNAWKLEGVIDVGTNGGFGFNLEPGVSISDPNAPRSIQGGLICAQSNTAGGVYVGTRSNVLTVYSEANGGNQGFLDVYAASNVITSVEGAWVDSTPANFNMILADNIGGSYLRQFQNKALFSGGAGLGLRVSDTDGTAGYLDLEKTGSVAYSFKVSGSGQDQTITFTNTQSPYLCHLNVGGNVFPVTDNVSSIGTSGKRYANVYGVQMYGGNIQLSNLVAAGPANTLTLGAQFSASATAGGGAATPATVAGFIMAYIGSTQVKIPYYAA